VRTTEAAPRHHQVGDVFAVKTAEGNVVLLLVSIMRSLPMIFVGQLTIVDFSGPYGFMRFLGMSNEPVQNVIS
jgi:hypothetical protein